MTIITIRVPLSRHANNCHKLLTIFHAASYSYFRDIWFIYKVANPSQAPNERPVKVVCPSRLFFPPSLARVVEIEKNQFLYPCHVLFFSQFIATYNTYTLHNVQSTESTYTSYLDLVIARCARIPVFPYIHRGLITSWIFAFPRRATGWKPFFFVLQPRPFLRLVKITPDPMI